MYPVARFTCSRRIERGKSALPIRLEKERKRIANDAGHAPSTGVVWYEVKCGKCFGRPIGSPAALAELEGKQDAG
jgi:hypothetical protein